MSGFKKNIWGCRRIILLLFCVLGIAGFTGGAEEPSRLTLAQYEHARQLYEQGVYGEAARQLESYLDSRPLDYSARKLLARIYLHLEDYPELEEQAEMLSRMRPEDEEAAEWLSLARREIRAELPRRAAELRREIEQNPEAAELRMQLAEIYARKERPEEAMESFAKAYSLEPDKPRVILAYARFAARMGRIDKAEELYLQYLEEEPDPDVRAEMFSVMLSPGMDYLEEEDYERAAAYYRQIVERYPEELHLRLRYARMLAWGDRLDESIGAYRSYLAEKDDPEARMEMIRVMAWNENFADAARLLREKLEREPENLEALVLLGDIYRWNDDMDSAAARYRRALEIDPEFQPALDGLDELEEMRRQRRLEARRLSISHMLELYREEPEDEDIRLQLARLYVAAGRHGEAREHFEFYLQQNPEETSVRREYARVLRNLEEYRESIHQLRRSLRDHPEDTSLRMEIVTMLMWEAQYQEARRELTELLELAPERADVHWQLARLHQMEAEWDEALHHYREVLRIDPDYEVARARIRTIERNPFRRLDKLEEEAERRPDDLEVRMELAEMLFDMERYFESMEYAREVLEIRPRHRQALALIEEAEEIMARRRLREIRRLREELLQDPRQHEVHLELARLLRQDEDYRRAEFHYRYYLRGYPQDFEVRMEYAQMLSWLPEYRRRAVDEYRLLTEWDPYDFELRRQRSQVLAWGREYWREAERELEEVLIFDPENLEMQAALADLHRFQGRYAEARERYERIELMDPENERALAGLEAIKEALRPEADIFLGAGSDNDGFSHFSFGGRYHHYDSDGTRWTIGGTFYNFSESADAEVDWDGGSSAGVEITGAVEGALAEYVTGSAWVQLGSYSLGGNVFGGGLRGSYDLSPINTLSLEYSHRSAIHEVGTLRALAGGVDVDTIRLDWDSEPPPEVEHREPINRLFFEGFLSYSSFSDSNLRTSLLVRPYYRFRDRDEDQPSIDLLAGWRSISFTSESDFYWSPSSYSGPLVGARVAGPFWWDFDYRLELEAYFPDTFTDDEAGGVSRSLNVNFNRQLSEQWFGEVNFTYSGSPREDDDNYNYFGVMFNLFYEF